MTDRRRCFLVASGVTKGDFEFWDGAVLTMDGLGDVVDWVSRVANGWAVTD